MAHCGTVIIPPGASGRKRNFKVKLCWKKGKMGGIKSLKKSTGKVTHGCTSPGRPKRGLICGGKKAVGSKRRKAAAPKRRRRATSTPKRRTRRKQSTLNTFKAKKSFAVTASGKLRKGCKTRRRNGRIEYRCKKTGAARW